MKRFHLMLNVILLPFLASLISCTGNSDPNLASGGIDGSGVISQGPITSFGSVIVNGTRFDTTNAIVVVNGQEVGIGDEAIGDQLDIGMVTTVEGIRGSDPNSGIANYVTYSHSVKGPIQGISVTGVTTKTLQVLGQTVVANAATHFVGTTWETIAIDDVVAVSGFMDDMGTIYATFIEAEGAIVPGLAVEVTGHLENLDVESKTFSINGLTVDYSLADTSALSENEPSAGLLVEAQGTLDATDQRMIATAIRPGETLEGLDADEVEITGFITDFISSDEFVVGNQPVRIDSETLFVDVSPSALTLNNKIEAEGALVDGVLEAWEIEFWQPDQIEVGGLVTRIDGPTEFWIGTQRIQIDPNTVFDGGVQAEIILGALIEVKGVPTDASRSTILADKVSFEEN